MRWTCSGIASPTAIFSAMTATSVSGSATSAKREFGLQSSGSSGSASGRYSSSRCRLNGLLSAAVDQFDAVLIRIADEADPRTALAYTVWLALGLDPLLFQLGECRVEIVHGDRDVAVGVAELVLPTIVVEGELEHVVVVSEREEVVRRLPLAVADDVHVTAEGEAERFVEGAALLGIGDAQHRVQVFGHQSQVTPRSKVTTSFWIVPSSCVKNISPAATSGSVNQA